MRDATDSPCRRTPAKDSERSIWLRASLISILAASPIGDICGDTRDMEFKDHAGPVYALHRVFTLNDVDWPHLEMHDDEREPSSLDETRSQGQSSNRMTPSHS
jgi:hypothetical protein